MTFVKVADKNKLKPGEGIVVEANGKNIALFNLNGNFYALDNVCRHVGGPIGEGSIDNERVSCPWHGWTYDIKTGKSVMSPDIKLEKYNVKVVGNDVMVEV